MNIKIITALSATFLVGCGAGTVSHYSCNQEAVRYAQMGQIAPCMKQGIYSSLGETVGRNTIEAAEACASGTGECMDTDDSVKGLYNIRVNTGVLGTSKTFRVHVK